MSIISFRANTTTNDNLQKIIDLMLEYENITGCGTLKKDVSHIIRTAITKELNYWQNLVSNEKSKKYSTENST